MSSLYNREAAEGGMYKVSESCERYVPLASQSVSSTVTIFLG
jgi:hypothetical protein